MKSKLFVTMFIITVIVGCQKDNQQVTPAVKSNSAEQTTDPNVEARLAFNSEVGYNTTTWEEPAERSSGSKFIPVLEANEMIGSYLYSIHSDKNDHDVRSFSVDADMLRAYLADNSVKNVKLIFAHTPGYINAGHKGHHAGYQTGALTIVIAGYDNTGKYVFHEGKVLDHIAPCPYTCPPGAAGSDLLY